MYQMTRLENGLRIVTAQMPHMTSVSLGLWVGVGSRHEDESERGCAHFIEHLLFKGTKQRTAQAISKDIEGIGGTVDAFTTEEHTCLFAKARYTHLSTLIDVLFDMVLWPRFEPAEIEKERSVIKEEIAMYNDQPSQLVLDLLNQLVWPSQPLGRSILGTEESLDRLRRHQVRAFHRAHYIAPNLIVAAAGYLTHREVVDHVTPYANRLRGKRPTSPINTRTSQRKPRLLLHTKETEQTQLALGIRVASRHDRRRYALSLLNTLLAEHSCSRLFQTLREEHGLVYSIYSSLSLLSDTGLLTITAGVESRHLAQTTKLITRELARLTQRPPSASELKLARDYLIGQMDLSLESTESQMTWLGEQVLGYQRLDSPDDFKDRLLRLQPTDLCDVASDFFRPSRLNLALVSPLRSARAVRDLLAF